MAINKSEIKPNEKEDKKKRFLRAVRFFTREPVSGLCLTVLCGDYDVKQYKLHEGLRLRKLKMPIFLGKLRQT